MRPRFELSVLNAAATVANIYAADREIVAALRRVVHENGEATRDLTYFLSPVDTGFMREHVKTIYTPNGLAWETGWDASDFIEAGFAFYPFFQEYGTRYMAAQPSLGPAYASIAPQHQRDVRDAIRQAIARRERAAALATIVRARRR